MKTILALLFLSCSAGATTVRQQDFSSTLTSPSILNLDVQGTLTSQSSATFHKASIFTDVAPTNGIIIIATNTNIGAAGINLTGGGGPGWVIQSNGQGNAPTGGLSVTDVDGNLKFSITPAGNVMAGNGTPTFKLQTDGSFRAAGTVEHGAASNFLGSLTVNTSTLTVLGSAGASNTGLSATLRGRILQLGSNENDDPLRRNWRINSEFVNTGDFGLQVSTGPQAPNYTTVLSISTSGATVGMALCLNSSKVLSTCTSAVGVGGYCTCP